MLRTSWVCIFALILAACNVIPATPVSPSPTGVSGTPVPVYTETPLLTATATPLPPALPVVTSPMLAHIDFQDASRGWGIVVNGNGHIVRTVDGGKTWLNTTPAGVGQIGPSASLFMLDTDHVWALVPGADFYSASLYRTSDGGITWSSNMVPFGGAALQFVDASTGRALADRGAGAGSNAVGLYQTPDAGITWTSVFHNDPTEPGSSDSLPLGGIKNGMVFLNANTGWVTGSLPVAGNVYLYITHDGGISWAQQNIPLPAGYESYLYMAHTPIFFGQEGLLPLTIYLPDSTSLTFYLTHDGGATWTGDPSAPARSIPPGRYSFADALHGWSWDGGSTLYSSSNAGLTWQGEGTNLNISGTLNQIDFTFNGAGSYTGWALTGLDENNHSKLYQTNDGGITWTPLIP